MRIRLRNSKAKGEIVHAILNGRISVIEHHGKNLGQLVLNKAEVEEFVLEKRREIEEDTYSLPEAAKRTGLNTAAVSRAIELGFLTSRSRNGRTRVLGASVTSFSKQYLPLSVIAKKLDTTTRWVLRTCRKNGVSVLELRRSNTLIQPILPRVLEQLVTKMCEKEQEAIVQRKCHFRRSFQESALRAYLQRLSDCKEPLPRRAGQLNKASIAKACGFYRDVLYNNVKAVEMLNRFAVEESKRLSSPIDTLRDYLKGLQQTRGQLPLCAGKPNKRAIAKACGVHRNVFYVSPEAISLLKHYAAGKPIL